MICFTVWWSLKVIIVLLHSLDKSRRLCVSVFTHYPVTATKPTQQKRSKKFQGTKTGQNNSFWSKPRIQVFSRVTQSYCKKVLSLTQGSLMWWHGQWLPGLLRSCSQDTAPRDVLWKHLKQGRAVMMEELVQAAIQRASPNLNKQEDKTAQQWQGWNWVGFIFK